VYIQRLIASYFEGRLLLYETDSGQSTHRVSGGVPQGSVLGPLLWNVIYDGMPEGTRLIGLAEDVATVVTAKKLPNAERICNEAGKQASAWVDSKGLALAAHKTEAVSISSSQKVETATIKIGEATITSRPSLKYLGVMIDHRLSFKEHGAYASGKASRTPCRDCVPCGYAVPHGIL